MCEEMPSNNQTTYKKLGLSLQKQTNILRQSQNDYFFHKMTFKIEEK